MAVQDVFVHPAGQDDNLGDSALRQGLLRALRGDDRRLHVHLDAQSSDYMAGVPMAEGDILYRDRREWLRTSHEVPRPVYVVNAGEINPPRDMPYPHPARAAELKRVIDRGGVVIAAGVGLKDPALAATVQFDRALREASVMSWRDHASRDAAGFGDVAPDWAFTLGSESSTWSGREARRFVAVTLRFDRPWPEERWFNAVRALASRHDATIVTVAQVARDAPLAVRLAEALGGIYLVARSTCHDDLDTHVRSVYAQSLAVVSDRAHALIMGATEGAYPLGTAADPQKIKRLLDTAGVGALTGHHDGFAERAAGVEAQLPGLPAAIGQARGQLSDLTARIQAVLTCA